MVNLLNGGLGVQAPAEGGDSIGPGPRRRRGDRYPDRAAGPRPDRYPAIVSEPAQGAGMPPAEPYGVSARWPAARGTGQPPGKAPTLGNVVAVRIAADA